jgi:hypothetical protein
VAGRALAAEDVEELVEEEGVENRLSKLNVAKMTGAVLPAEATSSTGCVPVGGAHAGIINTPGCGVLEGVGALRSLDLTYRKLADLLGRGKPVGHTTDL